MKKQKKKNNTAEKAMGLAIKYEKKRGCNLIKDVSKKGVGYDFKSGKRLIEVKGFYNERYPVISLYKRLKKQLGKEIKNYYIYVIYDIDSFSPKLKILTPSVLKGKIEKDYRYIVRGRVYRPIKEIKL